MQTETLMLVVAKDIHQRRILGEERERDEMLFTRKHLLNLEL